MEIMVAGSRYASYDLERKAREWLYNEVMSSSDELQIIVGDNPHGIDKIIVEECLRLNVPFISFGISTKPRNALIPIEVYSKTGFDYTQRDQRMINMADRCAFFWNGKSPGTKAGYDYALSIGKPAELITLPKAAPSNACKTLTIRTGRICEPGVTDITVKSGTGDAKVLAPTWDMVMGHKNGSISDEQYTQMYLGILRERYLAYKTPFLDLISQGDITLACYCAKGKFCHRHLAVDVLRKIAEHHGYSVTLVAE